MSVRHRRRQKLPRPGLQMRLVTGFMALLAVGMSLQLILLHGLVERATAHFPGGGGALGDMMPELMLNAWFYSFVCLMPLLLVFGVLFTFRLAGPVSRLENYLRAVVRGETDQHCKLRGDDELQELCDLLNNAMDALRREGETAQRGSEKDAEDAREPDAKRVAS